jgi:hypothetical protein
MHHTQEAPGPRTGTRRKAGVQHDALNSTIDHDKDADRVLLPGSGTDGAS